MMFVSPSRRQQAVALLVVSVLCIGVAVQSGLAREQAGDAKGGKDEAPFQGNWSVVKVTKDGMDIPEEFLKEVKVNFKGVKLSMSIQDLEKKGTIKIDSTKKPAHIDLEFEGGGDENGYGIYEFNGDTVKIYAAEKKDQRPKDFKTEAPLVIVLKKLAADKGDKTDKKQSPELDGAGYALIAVQGKTAKHPLEGTWKITSGNNSGKELPPELVGKITAAFEGDKVTLTLEKDGNSDSKKGTFKVDDKAKPHHIDLTEGGKTSLGIYEVDGDTLKLCMSKDDEPRPKEFKAEAGSFQTNMVFKREKAGKQPRSELTAVAPVGPAKQAKPAGKSDSDLAQGQWQLVSLTKDGMKVPAEEAAKMRFFVKGDTISLQADGKDKEEHAAIKLDPSKKPKQIDIMPTGSGDKLVGIYELTADTFKVCAIKDGPRPTEFKSDAGSDMILLELKRGVEKKTGKIEHLRILRLDVPSQLF